MTELLEIRIYSLISQNKNDESYEEIKKYIQKGANIHYNNDVYIMLASTHNNPKTMKFLLKRGCLNKEMMEIALDGCVIRNYTEVIKVLLNYGVNINADDGKALKTACLNQNIELIKFLLNNGADPRPVLSTYYCRTFENLKLLLEHNPNYNLKDQKILFDYCCSSEKDSNYEIVKYLLDYGFSLVVYRSNPIDWCIHKNNINIIKLFMEKGVKITTNCIKICTDVSRDDSHFEIVKLFYENGTNFYFAKFDSSNIQILKLLNTEFENIEFRNSDICPISYESFTKEDEKLGCIKCKNVFKKDALNEWLKYNPICPMCRECSRFQKVNN